MENKAIKAVIAVALCLIIIIPVAIKCTHSAEKILTEATRDGADKLYCYKVSDKQLVIAMSPDFKCNAYIIRNVSELLPLGYKIVKTVTDDVNTDFDDFNRDNSLPLHITTISRDSLSTGRREFDGYLILGAFDNRYQIDEIYYHDDKMNKIDTEGVSIFWLISNLEYKSSEDFKITYNS